MRQSWFESMRGSQRLPLRRAARLDAVIAR
jgi:hypothetical protein